MSGAAVVCPDGLSPDTFTDNLQMCVALSATGWWIYVDQLITPDAVVVCVIIYNAAFGYR